MKNLLFALFVILLDVMGCGPRHHEEDTPYLKVSPNALRLASHQDASASFSVSSNVQWTIVSNNGQWLRFYPVSGQDDATVIITALSANELDIDRECTITIYGKNIYQEVTIVQKGKASVGNKEGGAYMYQSRQ